MKINEHEALFTSKILLVPYSARHVPTYHEWMKDSDLQAATASEPLTLEKEYEMQISWRIDADKLTFIACTPPSLSGLPIESPIISGRDDTPDSMVGDVNLFLSPDDEESEDDAQDQPVIGEIEIMIASKAHRGKGLGRAVLLAFMYYILTFLASVMEEYHASHGNGMMNSYLKHLRVKIDKDNVRSIKLFESVGFRKMSEEPNYFGEVELRWTVDSEAGKEVEGMMEELPQKLRYQEPITEVCNS